MHILKKKTKKEEAVSLQAWSMTGRLSLFPVCVRQ